MRIADATPRNRTALCFLALSSVGLALVGTGCYRELDPLKVACDLTNPTPCPDGYVCQAGRCARLQVVVDAGTAADGEVIASGEVGSAEAGRSQGLDGDIDQSTLTLDSGSEAGPAPIDSNPTNHDDGPTQVFDVLPTSDLADGPIETTPTDAPADPPADDTSDVAIAADAPLDFPADLPWADDVPGSCPSGTYLSAGQGCVSCPASTFSLGGSATACTAWKTCQAGTFVLADGTASSDRSCTTCPNATFSTTANSSACAPWTNCVSGSYVSSAGSAIHDRGCQTCPNGTYSTGTNAASCTALADCSPGTYVSAINPTTGARTCTTCTAGSYSSATNATSCSAWTDCQPGSYVSGPGTTSQNRVCQPCTSGTTSTTTNASSCTAVPDCSPGTYVSAVDPGTGIRTCTPCATGSFSVAVNATSCVSWTNCSAGNYVSRTGSATADRLCSPCGASSFSTTTNAAVCAAWSNCAAGTYISSPGSATADRGCTGCTSGTFSAAPNATSCSTWTDCNPGQYVSSAGTASSDRACNACGAGMYTTATNASACSWLRQFGSTADALAYAIALDSQGNILVAGRTNGTLPGQTPPATGGAFVRKYDSAGGLVWSRQYSMADDENAYSVAADASGNVYVAGVAYLYGSGQANGYVRKHDSTGTVLWTKQFGAASTQSTAWGVAVGASGVFVAGYTEAALTGTNLGGRDAVLLKYSTSGTLSWTQQFGSAGNDEAQSVAVDTEGNILVGGNNYSTGPAFVRKFSGTGTTLWTQTIPLSTVFGVIAATNGSVVAAGLTDGALDGPNAGLSDAFVRLYDSSGSVIWTRQFGTSGNDYAYAVGADVAGNFYAAGFTGGSLVARPSFGGDDAFVRKFDSAGTAQWTQQFGTSANDSLNGILVDATNRVIVAGNTTGTFVGQTKSGTGYNAFVGVLSP